jgi:hypothetical protein
MNLGVIQSYKLQATGYKLQANHYIAHRHIAQHHYIATSLHRNITTSQHHYIATSLTSLHRNITTSQHRNITTSQHHYIATSPHQNINIAIATFNVLLQTLGLLLWRW